MAPIASRSSSSTRNDDQLVAAEQALAARDDRSNTGAASATELLIDLQHLGGRGLLLERLLGLVEQARVLDRDHGLVGEGPHQVDVGLGERLDPAAQQRDHADRLAVAQHRHREHRAEAVPRLQLAHVGVLGVDAAGRRPRRAAACARGTHAPRSRCDAAAARPRCRGSARIGVIARSLSPGTSSHTRLRFRLAQQPGALGDGVEHRLHVGRRGADHLQHLGRRGLALERLLGLVEQAHVLDRDHRLVGEGLQQVDLAFGERPGSARVTAIAPTISRSRSIGTARTAR